MPKIYVGTYAKYNNGNLHGEWVDLTDFSNLEDVYEYCKSIHQDESDPELMFQDWEDIPDEYINESFLDAEVFEWLELTEEDREMLEAYRSLFGGGSFENAQESFQGKYDSEYDFAVSLMESCYTIPDYLQNYIDYEKFARDLFIGDYSIENGYVFSCH